MSNVIRVYKSNKLSLTHTVTDSAGDAFDLTGYTMTLNAKSDEADEAAAVVLTSTATIASPTTGVGVFTITKTDTDIAAGEYYYDISIDDGSTDFRTTVKGKLIILQNVTQAS